MNRDTQAQHETTKGRETFGLTETGQSFAAPINSNFRSEHVKTQVVSGPHSDGRISGPHSSRQAALTNGRRSDSAMSWASRFLSAHQLTLILFALPISLAAFNVWAGLLLAKGCERTFGIGPSGYNYLLAHFEITGQSLALMFLLFALFNYRDFVYLRRFVRLAKVLRVLAVPPSPQELQVWKKGKRA